MSSDQPIIRGMKRIGTSGSYFRITPANEHLLNDRKMAEVELIEEDDGRLVELNTRNRDFLASKDLARVVSEILNLDDKRTTLVAHANSLLGGTEALEAAGIEVPEQSVHDTPAGRSKANQAKQAAKNSAVNKQKRVSRTKRRNEIKAADAENEAKAAASKKPLVEGVTRLPPVTMPPANPPEQTMHTESNDEDI